MNLTEEEESLILSASIWITSPSTSLDAAKRHLASMLNIITRLRNEQG